MKKALRKEIIQNRLKLSLEAIKTKSDTITNKVIELNLIEGKNNVMLYVDFRNEVMTKRLINYVLKNHITLILPRIDMKTRTMSLHIVNDLKDLVLSSYGILEPPYDLPMIKEEDVDLIISPGVAFDREGYRLGYGGGFYDRLLSQKRKEVPVVSLAFDLQIVKQVPTEPHDIQVNYIVTENEVIKPSSK